jgi:dynein heavy chain
LASLQFAIQAGTPCLLENVGEQLDSGLESILLRHTFNHGGVECILLGDVVVEYNPNFKVPLSRKFN